jgi:BASS family bile acid:Na+ symporter
VNAPALAGQVVLFLLMLVVGLELTPADFRRVFASPRAVIGGTLGQILLLPAMTCALVWGLGLNPVFGAGAVLVAVSPGAGMSNIATALARGNIALSVTLTAIASVLAVVTLPTFASLALGLVLDSEANIVIPVGGLMLQLALTLLLPIGTGMWLRTKQPERADRLAPILHRVLMASIVVVVVVSIGFAEADPLDYEGSGLAFFAAGLWTLSAMAIGWGIASVLRLNSVDRFTFLIEFSARNIAVASIVALSGLGRLDLTLFSGIYASVGYPITGLLVFWHRRRVGASQLADRSSAEQVPDPAETRALE